MAHDICRCSAIQESAQIGNKLTNRRKCTHWQQPFQPRSQDVSCSSRSSHWRQSNYKLQCSMRICEVAQAGLFTARADVSEYVGEPDGLEPRVEVTRLQIQHACCQAFCQKLLVTASQSHGMSGPCKMRRSSHLHLHNTYVG